MKRPLLYIGNHNPANWSEEQKLGWDIIWNPFPNVSPEASRKEVMMLAQDIIERIRDFIMENRDGKVCLQGEFTLCSYVFSIFTPSTFVFPTTKREVVERIKEDGSVEKTVKFNFVQWR